MSKKDFINYFERGFIVWVCCGIVLATSLLSSCKEEKTDNCKVISRDVYYTCSMHPQIHADRPGDCPVCGMRLIAVSRTSNNTTKEIHLNSEQITLGNI